MPGPTIRQRFARWLLKAATRPFSAWYTPGTAYSTKWDYGDYARDGFASNPYVYRCVRLLSMCGSSVAPTVYRLTRGGDRVELDSAERNEVVKLLGTPNARQGWPEFTEEMLSYYLVGGQSFALGVGPRTQSNPNAAPQELWTLEPDLVSPIPGKFIGEFEGFSYAGKQTQVFATTTAAGRERCDVWWFKGFDAEEPWQGMPPAAAARYAIDACTAALKYNKAILENGGVPGTVLHFEAGLTDEEAETAKRHFEASFSGDNRGRTHVTSGGVDIKPYGFKPSEMSWAELIEQTATQIACAYSVPPQLVGAKGQLTYNSYREAGSALWRDGVFPLLDRYYASLTRYVNGWFSGGPYLVTYDKDSVDALKDERTAVWDRVNASTFLLQNEKREALGYNKVSGGDVMLVPAGMIPLSVVTGEPDVTEEV